MSLDNKDTIRHSIEVSMQDDNSKSHPEKTLACELKTIFWRIIFSDAYSWLCAWQIQEAIWDTRDQLQVDYMQDKCPSCCSITVFQLNTNIGHILISISDVEREE